MLYWSAIMPELPEVETIVRDLLVSQLLGTKILKATVFWSRSIAEPDAEEFCQRLRNQKILDIRRRGKLILFTLDKDILLIHLRMTGKFTLSQEKKELSAHERVRLELSDGRVLHYEDQRKFGKWYLVSDAAAKLGALGVEPLSKEFTLPLFKTMVLSSTQKIKAFLLNQKHVVGLGNIYVDEALWHAMIHPEQSAHSLPSVKIAHLHKAIISVLEQGIAHQGTSLGSKQANYFSVSGRRGGNQTQLNVFRRDGQLCPRCQTVLIKIRVAQRGTHLCPHCQVLSPRQH